MKVLIYLLVLIMVSGCAGARSIGNNESYVVDPNGNKYLVSLRKDAIVEFKHPDGSTIKVDNRGREGLVEGLVKLYGVSVLTNSY